MLADRSNAAIAEQPVNVIDFIATFAARSIDVRSALDATNPVICVKSAKFGIDVNVASCSTPVANVNIPVYSATSDSMMILSPFASNAACVSVAGFAAINAATYLLLSVLSSMNATFS